MYEPVQMARMCVCVGGGGQKVDIAPFPLRSFSNIRNMLVYNCPPHLTKRFFASFSFSYLNSI